MGGVAHNEIHFLFVCVLDFDRGRGWRGDEAVDRGRERCWLSGRIWIQAAPRRAARGAGQHNTNVRKEDELPKYIMRGMYIPVPTPCPTRWTGGIAAPSPWSSIRASVVPWKD
ncbi:uncharacterized protein [Triticum aestivum]|uniref:uncharacterized protein n=1 Tax=Triticum aestivum TaxID=4565 RepID=UPI001D00392F|nr:uncharacterized protein LOC123063573 [Triticum aestivum]